MLDFPAALHDAVVDPWRFALVLVGCLLVRRPAQLVAVVVVSVGALTLLPPRAAPTLATLLAGVLATLIHVAVLYAIVRRVRRGRAAEDTATIPSDQRPAVAEEEVRGRGRMSRTRPDEDGRGNGHDDGDGNGD